MSAVSSQPATPKTTMFPWRDILFYGLSTGVVAAIVVHVLWRQIELHEFERHMREGKVPSGWFESPKARAGLIPYDMFDIGPTFDDIFWPLAGVTIVWYRYRARFTGLSKAGIAWCACVAAYGILSVLYTNSQFQDIMAREVPRKLQSVAEWEKRKAEEEDSKKKDEHSSTESSTRALQDASAVPPESTPAPTSPAEEPR